MNLLVATCLALIAATNASAESRVMTWQVDGAARRAIVFAPATAAAAPAPLLFVFHGAGDTADNFSGVDFQGAWPEAIVVYMDGLGRGRGGGGAFQTADATGSNRDLRFFDTALADLHMKFRVDDSRIYATGFSNGAKFVYLLWATRPSTFAAFAPVAGMLADGLSLPTPKPVIHIGGQQDHQNDIKLQLASIELARRTDGASASGKPCGASCTTYAGTGGVTVMTVLHSGGHVYPANATALIVNFLKSQTVH
jgi:polyhydroxybutyrate depolymerase